jgi:hypothetical protein
MQKYRYELRGVGLDLGLGAGVAAGIGLLMWNLVMGAALAAAFVILWIKQLPKLI